MTIASSKRQLLDTAFYDKNQKTCCLSAVREPTEAKESQGSCQKLIIDSSKGRIVLVDLKKLILRHQVCLHSHSLFFPVFSNSGVFLYSLLKVWKKLSSKE